MNISSIDITPGPEEVPIPVVTAEPSVLRVATFNLLGTRDADFIVDVGEEMKKLEIDVVSIQGCHKHNLEALFRAFKQRGYLYTRFDQMHTRQLSEIMFYSSRVVVKKKEYTRFSNSAQGRGVCKYQLSLGKHPSSPEVWVISSQFEEGGSGNGYRKAQIDELTEMFSKNESSIIFIGDTNIPSWQNLREPSDWSDGWREKGTSDNERTTILDRMDQIWYRLSKNFKCTGYALVCECSERKGVMAMFSAETLPY